MPDELQSRQLFERCIDQHADSLFRVAFRLTGRRDLADELVQETYLNAWRSIDSLNDQAKIRGWMFSILRNQFSKWIRTKKRSASEVNQLAGAALDELAKIEEHPNQPETKTEQLQNQLQSAIEQLDENQKLPLLLVAMEGLSVDEAAQIIGIPRGTVLSRMHRGRERLKQLITIEL